MRDKHSRWILASALLAALGSYSSAIAVNVTQPWAVTVVGGPYNGVTGAGSFTYDDAALDGFGNAVLGPTNGLSLSLTLFSQTFDEFDDIDFNVFPQLTVTSFTPTNMDYIVTEYDGTNPTSINQPGVIGIFAQGGLLPNPNGGFAQEATLELVPEPATVTLCGIVVLITALRRRR